MIVNNDTRIAALKMALEALEEVQRHKGLLPPGDPEADQDGPQTFLDLVKQFAGNRVPESELVVAAEAIAQLFPLYRFSWS